MYVMSFVLFNVISFMYILLLLLLFIILYYFVLLGGGGGLNPNTNVPPAVVSLICLRMTEIHF